MNNVLKSKDLKISLLLAFEGLVASAFVAMYQIQMFSSEIKQEIVNQLGSVNLLIPIAALQGMIFVFIASFIGIKIANKVSLKLNFRYSKNSVILAVAIGLAAALVITLSDYFIFSGVLELDATGYTFSPIYFIAGVLYGGVVEEVLLRLFVMTLMVFGIWKVIYRRYDKQNIPNVVYMVSIILAAMLFAAGHLPITFQTIGSSPLIIFRCFLLNGIGGIGFGYLYWKHGLSYAMLGHAMTHVFMQAVIMPMLY